MPWEDVSEQEIQVILDQNPFRCPVCEGTDCVPAYGPENSPVLFIGESPGRDEIIHGKPFFGPSGNVLNSELGRYGLQLVSFRLANMWLHEPNKNNDCFEHGITSVLKEAKDRELVVLVGADTVRFFTGQSVDDWNGLLVHSHLLDNPYVFAMTQPAIVFNKSIGEMKFSVTRLLHYLKEVLHDE